MSKHIYMVALTMAALWSSLAVGVLIAVMFEMMSFQTAMAIVGATVSATLTTIVVAMAEEKALSPDPASLGMFPVRTFPMDTDEAERIIRFASDHLRGHLLTIERRDEWVIYQSGKMDIRERAACVVVWTADESDAVAMASAAGRALGA